MKYADRLERVAQRLEHRGFMVIRQKGWRDRGRFKNGRPQDMVSIESLVVHHTATGGRDDYRSLKLVTEGRGEPNPLEGPLSNWGAGRLGNLYLIAAGSANHTGATRELWQSNQYASGLEAENNGVGEPWSPALQRAITAWAQEMRREFGMPAARVLGHREICVPVGRKIDPANFDMNALRRNSEPPNLEDDDLTPEQDQMLRDVYKMLIGDDSVASRVDGRRMPLREMVEYVDEGVYKLVKKEGL